MSAPRTLAAAAVVVLVVVAGALTLRPGGDTGGRPTASPRVAGGPVVDWAPSADTQGSADPATPDAPAAPASGAGEGAASVPAPVRDDPADDDGADDVHAADSPQTSLLAAAAAPVGPGVTGPAAGVTGDQTRPPVDPDDVLPPSAARGGCLPDYGDPGQCLPSNPPSSSGLAGPWTCSGVRELFPDGLIAGADPLLLDADGDGLACGPGD